MDKGFGEKKRRLHEVLAEQESLRYRHWWRVFVSIGLVGIFAGVLLVLFTDVRRESQRPVQVAATIFPIYDIVRNVAGPDISVGLVLPTNASPHTYEPTPSDVAGLADAELFFAVGHGLDGWVDGLVGSAAEKVLVDEGIAIMSMDDRHRAGADFGDVAEEDEGDTDPHYWLSVPNAKLIARNVRDALVEAFPGQEAEIEANHDRYVAELEAADVEIRDMFSGVRNRGIITLHDSWYYFAIAYDLDIAGTFEPSPGREPTPRYLADLSATVARIGARVLYSEPQIATESITPFAEDHGLRIAELDPLGGSPGRDSFIKLMKYDAATIRQNQD